MTKLSSAQLQAWYKQFSKELYEKVQIDLTRVEDLGRVKNFYYWDAITKDDPFAKLADFHYAFMDVKDGKYVNPEPNPLIEFQDYANWMMENMNPNVDEEKIQQLYEMSRAGTLMVYAPGITMSAMQQVYTDETGHILISRPMYQYADEATQKEMVPGHMRVKLGPEERRPPKLPGELIEDPDPAKFGLTGAPPKPVKPENMKPDWLSWLGYLLGLDTDYAKLKRYEEESATYEDRWEKWLDKLDREKPEVSQYLKELWKREAYLQQVKEYLDDPLGQAEATSLGYVAWVTESSGISEIEDSNGETIEILPRFGRDLREVRFLAEQHALTPQGKLLTKLEHVNERFSGDHHAANVVRHLLGPRSIPTKLTKWVEDRIIDPLKMRPKLYELPADKDEAGKTKAEKADYAKKWNALAEIAGFAALSDPDVTGIPQKDGFSREETSSLNYTKILNDLITSGRAYSNKLTAFLEPAREKGMNAVYQYHEGKPDALAKLLCQSIRQINREAACLSSLDTNHAMNTLYLTDRLLQTLHSDTDLANASDLKPEELAEAKANAALYRVMSQGLEARQSLLEFALYKREMSDAQIQKAGRDMLFAEIISETVKSEHDAYEKVLQARPDRQTLLEELNRTSAFEALKIESEEAARDQKPELAQTKLQQSEQMKAANEKVKGQMDIIDLERPGHQINKMLVNEEWVEKQKQMLQENTKLKHIHHMPREALGALAASSSKNIVEIMNPPPKVELRIKDEAAVMEEMQNMAIMH